MSITSTLFSSLNIPEPSEVKQIYNEGSDSVKCPESVAKRATALYLMATYAEGLIQRNCPHEESRKFIQKFITKFNAEEYFTVKEREFLENNDPSDDEIGVYCWRWESLHFLLWAFGLIENLGLPNAPCQQFECTKIFNRNRNVESFIKASKPHNIKEIIDVSNALEYISTFPAEKYDVGVLTEWRLAAKWLLTQEEWN